MDIEKIGRLLKDAQRGKTSALEELLVVCRPDLRRYATRYCLSSADAEDAVQETQLILYRKLPALRAIGAFTSWVFTIVRRECLRMSRRMLHREVPLDEIEEQRYLGARTDVELRLDIAMAIQSLPDIYREVIVMRDFEELTVREIAQRLDMLPASVKTRIHRGRLLIREHLMC